VALGCIAMKITDEIIAHPNMLEVDDPPSGFRTAIYRDAGTGMYLSKSNANNIVLAEVIGNNGFADFITETVHDTDFTSAAFVDINTGVNLDNVDLMLVSISTNADIQSEPRLLKVSNLLIADDDAGKIQWDGNTKVQVRLNSAGDKTAGIIGFKIDTGAATLRVKNIDYFRYSNVVIPFTPVISGVATVGLNIGQVNPVNFQIVKQGTRVIVEGHFDNFWSDDEVIVGVPAGTFDSITTMFATHNQQGTGEPIGIITNSLDSFSINRIDSITGNVPVSVSITGIMVMETMPMASQSEEVNE